MNRSITLRGFLQLIVISFFWGIAFLFIKVAINNLLPINIVVARLFFASIFLLLYVKFVGKKMPKSVKEWKIFFILGILNCSAPYLFITWGQGNIDTSLAAILGSTMPIFTIIFGHFSKDGERLTWGRMIGILLGLIGIILLIGPGAVRGVGENILSQLAIILASVTTAGATVYGSKLKGYDPVVVTASQTIAAFLIIIPFGLINVSWVWRVDVASFLAVLGLGIFCTAIPYIMFFRLLTQIGPTNCSLVTYLMPVVAVAMGNLLLGENLSWRYVIALMLILSGVAVVSGIRKPDRRECETVYDTIRKVEIP